MTESKPKKRKPKGRREPLTAAYSPLLPGSGIGPDLQSKPILLFSGRGDSRLTVEEARRLREDLLAAILDYEGDVQELAHAAHVAAGTAYDRGGQ